MLPNTNSTDVINTTNSFTAANARYWSIFKLEKGEINDKNNIVTEIKVDDEAMLITAVNEGEDVVVNSQESQMHSIKIPKRCRFSFLKGKKNWTLLLSNKNSVNISETVDTDNSMT